MPLIRTFLAALPLLSALAAHGHELPVNTCATDMAIACTLEAELPDIALADADPVVVDGSSLRLVGIAATGEVLLLDLSLADGTVVRARPIDLRLDPEESRRNPPFAKFAPDGGTLVLRGSEDPGAFLFFDDKGARLGALQDRRLESDSLSSAAFLAESGYEISAPGLFQLLLRQNLLTLDRTSIQGTMYRFKLVATLADGQFEVIETDPAMNAGDTLAAYLARRVAAQVEPVETEELHTQGALSAVTTASADGSSSRVFVRTEDGRKSEVYFDQHLGPHGFDYHRARLSPDGRFLAVFRVEYVDDPAPKLWVMVFDVATTAPILTATLPAVEAHWHSQIAWLTEGRVAVLEPSTTNGTQVYLFDVPAGD